MYELIPVGKQSYYIDCPAKIGVYDAGEAGVYLIDSGNDKDAGRKVRQILDKQGWHLTAILNTHSNADHIGGNKYLQGQTGCKIFAGGINGIFTSHPLLEPSFLYGGYPFKELRHKFLMAQESVVLPFIDPDFPAEVEILPLPGHFFDMVGFRIPDGAVFLADCLSSRETLDKYGIPFLYDVDAYLKTLTLVEGLKGSFFVPAHAEASRDLRDLAAYNRDKVLQVGDRLLELCRTPHCFEDLLAKLFWQYQLVMTFEQHALVGSTVRSFLSWLKDQGKITASIQDNRILWQTV